MPVLQAMIVMEATIVMMTPATPIMATIDIMVFLMVCVMFSVVAVISEITVIIMEATGDGPHVEAAMEVITAVEVIPEEAVILTAVAEAITLEVLVEDTEEEAEEVIKINMWRGKVLFSPFYHSIRNKFYDVANYNLHHLYS